MRRVLFLVNPLLAARGKRRMAIENCAAMLRSLASVEVRETLPGEEASRQARDAVQDGFDTIFACGGDGTFFYLLQGVAGSHVALGHIPLGTGNVLAQNLKLPRDPLAALRAQWSTDPISIPLGEAICAGPDGRERNWYFTIAAGVGFHAALMGLASNGRGKRLWGRAAYYGGGMRLLITRAVQPFEVEVRNSLGVSRHFRAAELLAVRVPAINLWRTGGDLSSPMLRIASVPQAGRLGLAHACIRALFSKQTSTASDRRKLPYPCYEEAVQVVCNAGDAPLPIQADGELIGSGQALFRMSQKQVRLLWPKQ